MINANMSTNSPYNVALTFKWTIPVVYNNFIDRTPLAVKCWTSPVPFPDNLTLPHKSKALKRLYLILFELLVQSGDELAEFVTNPSFTQLLKKLRLQDWLSNVWLLTAAVNIRHIIAVSPCTPLASGLRSHVPTAHLPPPPRCFYNQFVLKSHSYAQNKLIKDIVYNILYAKLNQPAQVTQR
jgi:hypothetical protein